MSPSLRAFGLLSGLLAGSLPLRGQEGAGAELWRLATVTVAVPPALAQYGSASFWNPAQPTPREHAEIGLDLIQTPSVVDASGILGGVRFRVPRLGTLGIAYGRMDISDLVQTSQSPEPDGPTIPFYTQSAALNWGLGLGTWLIGANVGFHQTQLDQVTSQGWSVDFGADYRAGSVVRVAAATHFLAVQQSAQDIYAGVEVRCWQGTLWKDTPATFRARAGITVGGVAGTDEQLGGGLEIGRPVHIDALVTRQQSYGNEAWRFVAALGIALGDYRVEFARDGGVNDVGAAYRVGLAVQL